LDNFQEDLVSIGCGYWARFYENLFNNGFPIDIKILERHLAVPDEIKAEGAAAVGSYLERLGDKVERLDEARIIILGEKGAGKTSLARKLLDINAEMPKEYESTEGVETHLWDFPNKDGSRKVNAHIWDFAGHSITHSAHRCFMSARCLYIYVYNGRIERDNDPRYWLEQIRIHGDNSPVLFLINRKDDRKVDIEEKTLKKEYPSIMGYYPVNIGNDDKTELEEFCQTVMDAVRNNHAWISQVVSEEAYKIKNELRKSFDIHKSPHIDRKEFNEIAEKCGASEKRIDEILNDLHTLGICLWYNDKGMEEFDKLVLNPNWITNGIYKIINKGYELGKYILSVKRATEILKDDKRYKYPSDMVKYLFRLMRKYELAFFHKQNTSQIFILGILPKDMPDSESLPSFDDANDRLRMEFVVEKVLPPNIATRIMVQCNGDIFNEKLLWRKGAVLKYKKGHSIALITEDSRRITVLIKGKDKTPYLASLREIIKGIFKTYGENIKLDLLYEILLPEDQAGSFTTPPMAEEEEIRDYIEIGQPLRRNKQPIPPDKTGQGYALSEEMTVISIDIRKSQELMRRANSQDEYAVFISALTKKLKAIIIDNYGKFDKFLGDGILAYFPASYSGKDGILHCCRASQKCHELFDSFYKDNYAIFSTALDTGLGIGIDYGNVNINEDQEIIGLPVNGACRLSSAPAGKTYLNINAHNEMVKRGMSLKETKMEAKNEGTVIVYELGLINEKDISIPDWAK